MVCLLWMAFQHLEVVLVETKIISISDNRQLTIPKEFFDKSNLGSKAECAYKDGTIIIKPLLKYDDDFTEEILKDLVAEGYEGYSLVEAFKKRRTDLKIAAEKLQEEGRKIASGDIKGVSFEEVFTDD